MSKRRTFTPEFKVQVVLEVKLDGTPLPPRYGHHFARREPGFGVTSVSYNLRTVLEQSKEPR